MRRVRELDSAVGVTSIVTVAAVNDAPVISDAGGTLNGTRYMLSLTFNAPRDAFDDPEQYLMQGRGVDDMFLPAHLCFRFMGMEPLETFVCYDVLKNPDIDNDFRRLEAHLDRLF
mgnify:CR=1 FL=1